MLLPESSILFAMPRVHRADRVLREFVGELAESLRAAHVAGGRVQAITDEWLLGEMGLESSQLNRVDEQVGSFVWLGWSEAP